MSGPPGDTKEKVQQATCPCTLWHSVPVSEWGFVLSDLPAIASLLLSLRSDLWHGAAMSPLLVLVWVLLSRLHLVLISLFMALTGSGTSCVSKLNKHTVGLRRAAEFCTTLRHRLDISLAISVIMFRFMKPAESGFDLCVKHRAETTHSLPHHSVTLTVRLQTQPSEFRVHPSSEIRGRRIGILRWPESSPLSASNTSAKSQILACKHLSLLVAVQRDISL